MPSLYYSLLCYIFKIESTEKIQSNNYKMNNFTIFSPNDLVVVGPDRFYLTNTCHFYNIYLHALEALLQLNVGSVIYYDGQKATTVASGFRSPNGIAVSADRSYLYVGSILGRTIHVYKLAKDMSIEKHAELPLLTPPDNIVVDAKTGDLWVGCQPVRIIFWHLSQASCYIALRSRAR